MAPALIGMEGVTQAIAIAKESAKRLDTEITCFKIGEDFRIHAPESKGIPVRITPGGILTIGGLVITAAVIYALLKGSAEEDILGGMSGSDNPLVSWWGKSGKWGSDMRKKLFGV